MEITKKSTQNQTKGRNNQKPIIITCHRTCGSFNGAVSWLQNAKSQASSHFVVAKDGRVVQLVDLEDTAWCNGTKTDSTSSRYYGHSTLNVVKSRKDNANSYTVSIEFEGLSDENGELTDIQFEKGVELVKHIVSEVKRIYNYNIVVNAETLVGHCHITPKWKPNCPGSAFPFEQMIERVNYMKVKRKFILIDEEKGINEEITLECIMVGDVTYMPTRQTCELLGKTVDYDSNTKVTKIK